MRTTLMWVKGLLPNIRRESQMVFRQDAGNAGGDATDGNGEEADEDNEDGGDTRMSADGDAQKMLEGVQDLVRNPTSVGTVVQQMATYFKFAGDIPSKLPWAVCNVPPSSAPSATWIDAVNDVCGVLSSVCKVVEKRELSKDNLDGMVRVIQGSLAATTAQAQTNSSGASVDLDAMLILLDLLQSARDSLDTLPTLLIRLGVNMSPQQHADFVQVMKIVIPLAKGLGEATNTKSSLMAVAANEVKDYVNHNIDSALEAVNQKIFAVFDVNNSSTLDYNEFSYIIGAMNIFLTECETRALFVQSDTDQDDLLTLPEFNDAMQHLREKILQQMMATMRISREAIIFYVAYTMFTVSMLLGFIIMGILAFNPGTSFTAVINTIITMGIGAVTSGVQTQSTTTASVLVGAAQVVQNTFQQLGPLKKGNK